jgi:Choline/Carnitine o-acyltransferase
MFNIGRIPQENCDTISPVPPPSHPDSKKILLMLHDWLYSVDVYDDAHQNLLKVGEIEKRFRAVVADATSRIARGERAIPVGLLSADRRDIWAKVSITFQVSPITEPSMSESRSLALTIA